MFTGLIEATGEVTAVKPTGGGVRLRIGTPLGNELSAGDSLAVNGVCLTVLMAADSQVHADIGPETLRATTLEAMKPGSVVNLERPLRADARLGGHFVQGHVDGTGTIEALRADGEYHWVTVRFPSLLAPYIIQKGSIAVDGISLTVAGMGESRFDVQVVPYTWDHTNLRTLRPGDRVNLECDIVGKYVVQAVESMRFKIGGQSRAH